MNMTHARRPSLDLRETVEAVILAAIDPDGPPPDPCPVQPEKGRAGSLMVGAA